MFKMLVVDDEYFVRKGVSETIQWENYGIELIDEASNGKVGLEKAHMHKPDIILTDIRMPFMDGLEFMEQIRANGLGAEIIVLSGFEDFHYVRTALNNGAFAYLLKPIDNEQLIETVQKAAAKIEAERGTRQYYNRLKNELSVIKRQFLLDLLSGSLIDRNAISEKIKLTDAPIDINNNFIVVIKINQYSSLINALTSKEMTVFRDTVLMHINQAFLQNAAFNGIVIDKSEEEWIALLHPNEPVEGAIDTIKQNCLDITHKLKTEFSQTVSIGISKICKDIEDISLTYKDACTACNYELLSCSNNVVYIDEKETAGIRREVKESIRYIKSNFSKDITVEMAAKDLFISSSYLMHIFKEDIGKTFNECLTDYRIQVARELLKDPRYKIYEVSEKVGYSDVKYFNKVFRKVTGMSPSEYMKQGL